MVYIKLQIILMIKDFFQLMIGLFRFSHHLGNFGECKSKDNLEVQ